MTNEQYKTLNKRTNSIHVILKKCMPCDITYLNVAMILAACFRPLVISMFLPP